MNSSTRKIQNVLLVDDDRKIRLVTQMSLESSTDWQIRCAASGEECFRLVSEQRPDLILLDIMMPDMEGTEIFGKLQEDYGKSIAVIFFTAKVQAQEVHKYKTMGAAGVIVKPFHPAKLASQIKEILQIET